MKVIIKYVSIFIIIGISVLLVSYRILKEENKEGNLSSQYTLKVINKDAHWIYEISQNNSVLIRQEYIPVVNGKQKFRTKKDAEAIGSIVLNRLINNKPPRVTKEDLIINKIQIDRI